MILLHSSVVKVLGLLGAASRIRTDTPCLEGTCATVDTTAAGTGAGIPTLIVWFEATYAMRCTTPACFRSSCWASNPGPSLRRAVLSPTELQELAVYTGVDPVLTARQAVALPLR